MGAFPQISLPITEEFQIPLPSIEVQQKIVDILDAFSSYTAELSLRKKQYAYYRDLLLTPGTHGFIPQNVQYVPLKDICTIKNGKEYKLLEHGSIPVYGSGGAMGIYVDEYLYNKPSVLIPRKGTITNIFYLDTPFWNVDTLFYTVINENLILSKYLYHFMQNFDIEKLATTSTRPSLTQTVLNKIQIPLPSLEVQQKIVDILDKFETLTSSITQGLPREIELRTKQYEYYRDQLLTFKERKTTN